MKPTVFIHTNHKQKLGAVVSRYSLQKNSAHADQFDVRFIEVKDFPCMAEREGQLYLRDGEMRPWLNNDLQSFTPLRFAPPQLMDYEGRAVVIDPDVFALGDVWELLNRDMGGKAIIFGRSLVPVTVIYRVWTACAPAASVTVIGTLRCSCSPSARCWKAGSAGSKV